MKTVVDEAGAHFCCRRLSEPNSASNPAMKLSWKNGPASGCSSRPNLETGLCWEGTVLVHKGTSIASGTIEDVIDQGRNSVSVCWPKDSPNEGLDGHVRLGIGHAARPHAPCPFTTLAGTSESRRVGSRCFSAQFGRALRSPDEASKNTTHQPCRGIANDRGECCVTHGRGVVR